MLVNLPGIALMQDAALLIAGDLFLRVSMFLKNQKMMFLINTCLYLMETYVAKKDIVRIAINM
ncbi:MAG TPA: hypothetical protein PLJ17_06035, partial [Syntrophorhabdaceae bacterium]|nr:hypothetical protein [Syntrophorhabdaceae bacterium]